MGSRLKAQNQKRWPVSVTLAADTVLALDHAAKALRKPRSHLVDAFIRAALQLEMKSEVDDCVE